MKLGISDADGSTELMIYTGLMHYLSSDSCVAVIHELPLLSLVYL
jgi:hypothetical protein